MAEQAVTELMEGVMEKLRSMVDSDAVVGAPITVPDGSILIPVSRVSLGFASGGSDRTAAPAKPGIWGGGGAAVKVEPVGFLLAKEGCARMLAVQAPVFSTADRLLDMVPEMLEKLESFLAKHGKKSAGQGKMAGDGNNKHC